MISPGVPPRMKPLSPRRSATFAALDVGTSKIACLIARLTPLGAVAPGDWRTHRVRVVGIGHQRSLGVKNGLVVDMDAADAAIRQTVDAAERMAGMQVERVIVTASGGRLSSQHFHAKRVIGGREVAEHDIHRVLEASAAHHLNRGRVAVHSLPTGFSLDGVSGIREPKDMIGEELAVDLHVATWDQAAARNLLLAVERSHLNVEAMAAAPYVAGLSTLEPDEAEMGVVVVDMGAGSTSVAVFARGEMIHLDAVTLGGGHVTMDIARGLDARLSDAERLKTFHGSAIASTSDERETISFDHVGESDHKAHAPKSHLVRIIRPRIEETLEFLRDRLAKAGHPSGPGRRIVLTGGASQLTGVAEAARRILGGQVRVGRPIGVEGLPDSSRSPAFAAAAGLLVYPQVAAHEYFEPRRVERAATGTDGYISRVGRWLRESF
ncbi:cell division protein FtsA [Methylocystis sp. SC2]|uniref:cell division protein FtsA n=1 Tax=Methylocystis sp. (strain SC2) TaxID=187303 RepID=UPI00027AE832|nr:cell division protein FtsA [Methylocystis sp. SC2]CCJ06121.1 Cell division protein FtsA [Methylocystis sp. SC2]